MFLVTDNAHLVAVSRVNGALLWEVVLPENLEQPYGGTSAPLVVGNLVIAGVSGGDEGIRGFLAAYRAETGESGVALLDHARARRAGLRNVEGRCRSRKGRRRHLAAGQLRSRDRDAVLADWQPVSRHRRQRAPGRQPVYESVLALDAQTGKLRWHFQFTPHDLWDWDAQEPLVLVDAMFQGRPRKLLLQANRNGFFYVLDRTDGKMLAGQPVREEADVGERHRSRWPASASPGNTPDEKGVTTCPAIRGATNWMSTSFHPKTRLFYVMAVENCFVYRSTMFGGGRGQRQLRRPRT